MSRGGSFMAGRTRLGIAGLTAAALGVAACGGSSGSSSSSGGGGGQVGKIALLLPETKTARYEAADKPDILAKLKALGYDTSKVIYANANQDPAQQQSQAEAAITNGASVLVLDPVDGKAAAAIADKAKQSNIPVVSYDRLILNTANVNYYVSFDNKNIGVLQAKALVQALKAGKNPNGPWTVVMINGSPTDNNAKLFKEGAHSILDSTPGLTIAKEYDTPDWSPDQATTEMQQAITALAGKSIDGVYCANDGTAGGAIAAIKAGGVSPLPPVTGQDAEVAGVQRVIAGQQYMTIYKAIKPEAEATAQIAFDLATGKTPDSSLTPAKINNTKVDVPSQLLTAKAVTKDVVKSTVVADGFLTAAQLCTPDFAQYCQQLGIS